MKDGWQEFNDHCYKFIPTKKAWPDAKMQCESQGSYLVTVHSHAENDFALSLISAVGANTWLGGNDKAKDGTWIWEDGKAWGGYTAWGATEPNGGDNEQCLELWYHTNGTWNDVSCAHLNTVMCKMQSFF